MMYSEVYIGTVPLLGCILRGIIPSLLLVAIKLSPASLGVEVLVPVVCQLVCLSHAHPDPPYRLVAQSIIMYAPMKGGAM